MALFDLFGIGSSPDYLSGFLSEEERRRLQERAGQNAMLQAGLSMLANSGYSQTPVSLGQILGAGGQAGLQGYQSTLQQGAQDVIMQQRMQEMKRKQAQDMMQMQAVEQAAQQYPEYADAIRANPELLKDIVKSQINVEVEYKDAGDRLVPVNKRTGEPVSNLQPIPKVETTDKLTNLIRIRDRLVAENPNNPNIKPYNDAIEKESQRAPAQVTQINMPFESNYQKTLGTKVAETQLNEYETANKAANNIQKIDMTLNQIQNSDATTGLGAEVINNVNRFRAQFLNDKKAGKKVADTQILDAFLGSDVFPQIGALGIGAKGLDTPAEREFLRQVMTGTINMDKAALLRMTQIRRDIEKRAIDRYNKGVQQGKYDKFFDATGYQKEQINIPEAPPLSSGTGGFKIRRIR